MDSFHGKFVWYELLTTDADAAEAFYRDVIGWGAQDAGLPDRRYTMLTVGERPVCGLMTLCEEAREMGARPGWIGYVAVEDVNASAAQVTQQGGTVHRAPSDIPGVGRFAIVSDPQGAKIALFRGSAGERQCVPPNAPGHGGWHELHATDQEAAFDFHSQLFGWTKAEPVDMGPMGTYQLFAAGGQTIGGMMTKPEAQPAPAWLYYFNVDRVDPAADRVRAGGGQITAGPHQVPGGGWIAHCVDPQGGRFAVVGPNR
ncbi:MAG: VOC family protein [Actinomycetota bacterium]|nr:VOC family protein [Actinomycetota bacterium]